MSVSSTMPPTRFMTPMAMMAAVRFPASTAIPVVVSLVSAMLG